MGLTGAQPEVSGLPEVSGREAAERRARAIEAGAGPDHRVVRAPAPPCGWLLCRGGELLCSGSLDHLEPWPTSPGTE
ncbi:hypothetical protein [Nocardia sp. BMG51109]|uniref:hypothetical protein n=1 Tax=Nocardia sp. BMG51109 TaxID=1056816 RepID=UPI0004669FC9|nr:hypothetical protein [Nocardia sp. BMG51109]